MTLNERIARVQSARTVPTVSPAHTHGWAPHVRCVACVGIPQSPFTRRALQGELPAKVTR